MTVVNFGDRPSGSIAVATLRKTAEMSQDEFPVASKVIKEDSYVDDILHSTKTREGAIEIRDSMDKILDRGGFKIKNWIMSGGSEADSINLDAEEGMERVLGMQWDPKNDKTYFKVNLNFSAKKRKIKSQPNLSPETILDGIPAELSKRTILSQINGIYDPRRLLAPFTV